MPFSLFRNTVTAVSTTPLVELDPALWSRVSGGSSGPHGGWARPAGDPHATAAHPVASVDPLGPHGGWKFGLSGPHGGW